MAHRRAYCGLGKVFERTRNVDMRASRDVRTEARRLFLRCAYATLNRQFRGGTPNPEIVVPERAHKELKYFLAIVSDDPFSGLLDVLYRCVPPVFSAGNLLVGEIETLLAEGLSVRVHGGHVLVPWDFAPGYLASNRPEVGSSMHRRVSEDLVRRKVFVAMTSAGIKQKLVGEFGQEVIDKYVAIGSCRGARYVAQVINGVFFPGIVIPEGDEQNIWLGASSSFGVLQLERTEKGQLVATELIRFMKPYLGLGRFAVVEGRPFLEGDAKMEAEMREFVEVVCGGVSLKDIGPTEVTMQAGDGTDPEKIQTMVTMFNRVFAKYGRSPVVIADMAEYRPSTVR